jgi:hypothetical protein
MLVLWSEEYYRTMVPYERYRFEWKTFTANDNLVATPPLMDVHPNPFHTEIRITMASPGVARLTIYNLKG